MAIHKKSQGHSQIQKMNCLADQGKFAYDISTGSFIPPFLVDKFLYVCALGFPFLLKTSQIVCVKKKWLSLATHAVHLPRTKRKNARLISTILSPFIAVGPSCLFPILPESNHIKPESSGGSKHKQNKNKSHRLLDGWKTPSGSDRLPFLIGNI